MHARHAGSVSDASFLERFCTEHDEAAFAMLVRRHAATVWRVCRRILRHTQDSEDVFQATFLTLVRKAASIGKGAALGAWLYRVAFRLALQARERTSRRAHREQADQGVKADPAVAPDNAAVGREVASVLHEEIARLPKMYREAIVLCYFEGKSYAEAATELLCPKGTVSIRLTRARELLRGRLLRRGVAFTGTLVGWLAAEATPAAVSSVLVCSTLRAATTLALRPAAAAGIPEGVLHLLQGASKAMLWTKLKLAVMVLAIIGTGAGLWAGAASNGAAPQASPRLAPPLGDSGKGQGAGHPLARPVGVWERQAGPYDLRLRVDDHRLFATLSGVAKNKPFSVTLEADYEITKDSLAFGVITSVEEAVPTEHDWKCSDFIDQPFSAHFRVDAGSLTVKNLKFMGGQGGALAGVIQGRYTRADAAGDAETGKRVRVLPAGTADGPPDEAQVLRALPRVPAGVPGVYQVFRQDVQIVSERLRAQVDAPRFYPLIGRCRLHREHWKCTVIYTQVEESSYPFPCQRKRPRVEVVYIDKEHLEPAE
jgi:RNA polymerase sigma factor (sigma-70 family)